MTKRILFMAVLACAVSGGLLATNVKAEDELAPEKIALIQSNCTANQATLNRLHQNDAFLRTNRGDLYRTVSEKLMLPFNQRLVANQLNAGQLIDITADFKTAYTKFFDSYIDYDNALADLLKIDCKKDPGGFYTALIDVRQKRVVLGEDNQALVKLITDYHTTLKEFKNKFIQDAKTS